MINAKVTWDLMPMNDNVRRRNENMQDEMNGPYRSGPSFSQFVPLHGFYYAE
jgi:hypothetical protein